jgi:hypothetical protein
MVKAQKYARKCNTLVSNHGPNNNKNNKKCSSKSKSIKMEQLPGKINE